MNTNIVAKTTAKRKPARAGVVYLLHFERPLGNLTNPRAQAQHYIGWALDVRQRLTEHRNGWGSSLTMACVDRGIPFYLVRFWPGTGELERSLKRQKNARKLCPVCRTAHQLADQLPLPLPLDFGDMELELLRQVPRKAEKVSWEEIQHYRSRAATSTVIDYEEYAAQYADCDIPL
jgi:predicted GIY-YIG superfamily endonuclease